LNFFGIASQAESAIKSLIVIDNRAEGAEYIVALLALYDARWASSLGAESAMD
jgi:hypothetical protein